MKLTQDQVRHVAKLARLKLSDEEVAKFSEQLSGVLEYMEVLNEVDTERVKSTSQVTGLTNVLREDVVGRVCDPKDLLECSPLSVERDQIKVKSVL